ncbi:MFS transporter [Desulfosporosinus sp. PR]|uniref:MFS transporter n=1 Tax=Candidatus Desulfosporosinus nitrosoreducens TaxID=3401928 RepID=UPI0027F8E434|nr:MFS transporter [Desulfosporosinus sp. PR]MDQ7092641.1 MFS transporter [Desulfosporosinus sp. PR]
MIQCPISAPLWKARYSVLTILTLCSLFNLMDRMILNVSLPLIGREFNINEAAQGFLISFSFLGVTLFQIPGGLITDKIGPRKVMTLSAAWAALFIPLTGMAYTYPMLVISRFLLGAGGSISSGSQMKVMATYFPRSKYATANAICGSVNSLAPALSTLLAAAIIGIHGWRITFIVLGIPMFLVASYLWFRFKDDPQDNPRITRAELMELDEDLPKCSRAKSSQISYKEFLTKPILWQLALIWFFFDFTYWGYTTWIPSYLMKERGFSLIKTSILGSLPYLLGTVSMIFGGYLSDHFTGRRKWVFIPTAILAAASMYLMFSAKTNVLTIIYQCMAAIFMFIAFGSYGGMQFDGLPRHIIASTSGLVNTAGQLAGLFSPFLLGYLIQVNKGYYSATFFAIIISLVLAAFVAVFVKKTSLN